MGPDTGKDLKLKVHKRHALFKLLKSPELYEKALIQEESDEAAELIDCIRSAKAEWINTNANFEYADEREIIDYYTYKLKACEVRYEYYLRKAKEKGLKVDLT